MQLPFRGGGHFSLCTETGTAALGSGSHICGVLLSEGARQAHLVSHHTGCDYKPLLTGECVGDAKGTGTRRGIGLNAHPSARVPKAPRCKVPRAASAWRVGLPPPPPGFPCQAGSPGLYVCKPPGTRSGFGLGSQGFDRVYRSADVDRGLIPCPHHAEMKCLRHAGRLAGEGVPTQNWACARGGPPREGMASVLLGLVWPGFFVHCGETNISTRSHSFIQHILFGDRGAVL